MSFLASIRDALAGYKTYVVGIVAILMVAVEVGLQADIPGFDPGPNWVEYITAALGLIFIRDAISKNSPV